MLISRHFFRLLLLVSLFFLLHFTNSAQAYIAVKGERLTLPEVIKEFRCVALVTVDRFDPDSAAVRYKLSANLLGKLPPDASLKHIMKLDGKLPAPLASLKPGDSAILFWGSVDPRSLILTPAGWFETANPKPTDDGWERFTKNRADLEAVFLGTPSELRTAITNLLNAESVNVSIRPSASAPGDDARLFIKYDFLAPHQRFIGVMPMIVSPRVPAPSPLDSLESKLKSEDPRFRQQAARLIAELDPKSKPEAAVLATIPPTIIAALPNSGIEVRAALLEALSNCGTSPENIDLIVPVLAKYVADEDRFVAAAASRALATLGPPVKAALPALVKALADRNYDFDYRPLRAAEAARAILLIAPPPAPSEKPSPEISAALKLLTGDKLLNDSRSDGYGTRAQAARLLATSGPNALPALPSLIKHLHDDEPLTALCAAAAILKLAPTDPAAKDATTLLQKSLTSPDPLLKTTATRALP